MYENRFLCGVDGVKEEGKEAFDALVGGVWARVPSFGTALDALDTWSGEIADDDG
jgi:hypothetical protein